MSKYTISIKNLINNNFNFNLSSYPIFDESYREILNNKILNHYYLREIGFETAELFNFYLGNKLNEIMPKYNILYENLNKSLENLIGNVNYTETFNQEGTGSANSKSKDNSNTKNLYLDTPQGNSYKGTIDETNYATDVTFNKLDSNNEASTSNQSKNSYVRKVLGNNGGKYSIDVLKELDNKFLNIDMMIINELDELFMQIF